MIFILSIVLGFLTWKHISGMNEGDKINRSLRFLIGDHYIHIHHWIWCSLLLLFFLSIGFNSQFILGLLIGSIIQGLLYRDRFIIYYRKDKFDEIYAKFNNNNLSLEKNSNR
jgi:hypothetical protein